MWEQCRAQNWYHLEDNLHVTSSVVDLAPSGKHAEAREMGLTSQDALPTMRGWRRCMNLIARMFWARGKVRAL